MSAAVAWDGERERLLAAAAGLGAVGRDAVRLADLLLARALAAQLGLCAEPLDESRLGDQLGEVALMPVRAPRGGRARRRAAVDAALGCAGWMREEDLFHAWSESSQLSDPGRKGRGAFSTPPSLGEVIAARGLAGWGPGDGDPPRALDPSAGHGALLLALLAALTAAGASPAAALRSLHGVELDPNARELCCLSLWLKAADRSVRLDDVASRVVLGNALTARWSASGAPSPEAAPGDDLAFAWQRAFPAAFAEGGFDLVVANPPWESLRHFQAADAADSRQREATRARLAAEVDTGRGLPPLYSAQGRGDRNLYKGFVELFPHLLSPAGRLVALLPGAFSSDFGMREMRQRYLDHMSLERWTGFENLAGYFPIDGRYKFGILAAARSRAGTSSFRVRFMAREAGEAAARNGHLAVSRRQLSRLGGPGKMFPEVTGRLELAVLERAFDRGSRFFDPEGSFGAIAYRRELDLTLDRRAGRFVHVEEARREGFRPARSGTWSDGSRSLVPLVEGRMVSSWDFFEKSWVEGSGRSARWRPNDGPLAVCQPQFLAPRLEASEPRLAICDVTSATNTRTMRATWVPSWPCGNTAPVLSAGDPAATLSLLGVLNSMTFDWILRRLAAGLHLNRFYLEAMPVPRVSAAAASRLAAFAAASMLAGRCRGLPRRELAGLKRLASHDRLPSPGEVEAIVAAGYGLDADHMRRVMDSSPADRKGLWRYYAAVPEAERIAAEGIGLLEAA
jgi:N-6 DNA Methylase